jgi:hypothetical protein
MQKAGRSYREQPAFLQMVNLEFNVNATFGFDPADLQP